MLGHLTGLSSTGSAELLRQNLLESLRSGAWLAGHRLPPERELGQQFGVSRSAVRRVLGQLKQRQLIRQIVGSGTYVCEGATQLLSQESRPPGVHACSPAELMAARIVLEPAICELVVGNATSADFARMDACCAGAEKGSLLEFDDWNYQLHHAIAEAAHNSFIDSLYDTMRRVQADTTWGALKRNSHSTELIAVYNRQHRELVTALKDRNLVVAAQHIRSHLAFAQLNLLGH
jgi:DNA-binding FadR family transcriptional regulator